MFIFGVAKRLETYKNLFLLSGGAARGSPGSLAGKKKLLARQFKLLAQLFGTDVRLCLPAEGRFCKVAPPFWGQNEVFCSPVC